MLDADGVMALLHPPAPLLRAPQTRIPRTRTPLIQTTPGPPVLLAAGPAAMLRQVVQLPHGGPLLVLVVAAEEGKQRLPGGILRLRARARAKVKAAGVGGNIMEMMEVKGKRRKLASVKEVKEGAKEGRAGQRKGRRRKSHRDAVGHILGTPGKEGTTVLLRMSTSAMTLTLSVEMAPNAVVALLARSGVGNRPRRLRVSQVMVIQFSRFRVQDPMQRVQWMALMMVMMAQLLLMPPVLQQGKRANPEPQSRNRSQQSHADDKNKVVA